MDSLYNFLLFLHFMSFIFMSVPMFNLIVVNERLSLSKSFNYHADRYMENIIKNGAYRCFAFQTTVLISGVLLLVFGPLGIEALWAEWVIMMKTILLLALMGMLSYVHFSLQPNIERLLADVGPDTKVPDDLVARLKPYRVRRKRMATFCLFLVITTVILGLQVTDTFDTLLTVVLIGLAGLFALRVNKTLVRFGWL